MGEELLQGWILNTGAVGQICSCSSMAPEPWKAPEEERGGEEPQKATQEEQEQGGDPCPNASCMAALKGSHLAPIALAQAPMAALHH